MGIYLPLLKNAPYDWNKVPIMGKIGGTLSALYSSDTSRGGNILRQFWESRAWVATMPHTWCVPCYHQQPSTNFLVYTCSDVTMEPIPNE